jgi:cytochrome c-type biogenesis protein CcmE
VLEHLGSRRVLIIAALATAVIIGVFSATNLASSAVYYLTPSEAKARAVGPGQSVRLGGLVKVGSLHSEVDRSASRFFFVITDGSIDVSVVASANAIPGLLREGAGAVVEGSFAADGSFLATQVIAKHDEVYTAPSAGATPAHRTSFP